MQTERVPFGGQMYEAMIKAAWEAPRVGRVVALIGSSAVRCPTARAINVNVSFRTAQKLRSEGAIA